MTKACLVGMLFVVGCAFPVFSQEPFEKDTVVSRIVELLRDSPNIGVRIRRMK